MYDLKTLTCYCARCKGNMDRKIKKLQRDTKKVVKEEASLLKEDKKHDKVIDRARKTMKGKC